MEVTEEDRDAAQEAKAQAMEAISDGREHFICNLGIHLTLQSSNCFLNLL